jgi:hypothetical protein
MQNSTHQAVIYPSPKKNVAPSAIPQPNSVKYSSTEAKRSTHVRLQVRKSK